MTEHPQIPLVDLGRHIAQHQPRIGQLLTDAASRADFILGQAVGTFESRWAHYVGAAHAVGVGNGTDALILALRAMGVGAGDVVLTQANTFIATALAIRHAGAELVLCDIDPESGALDIAQYDGPEPAVVVPVHLFGRPVDVAPIRARFPEARILEDAAQAHGAAVRGTRCGAMGDAAAFSFYPSKNLGALGDGGAVTTSDPQIDYRLRELRNLGSSEKFVHASLGVNSRLDTVQASVLDYKLDHLDGWNARRRQLAARLSQGLGDLEGVQLPADAPEGCEHVWHLYVVRVADRDGVLSRLRAAGIGAGIHYPTPVHKQQAFADLAGLRYPLAERFADEILSLPLFPEMTDDEADRVVHALREAVHA